MIYLAAPFADPDPDIRYERFETVIQCQAKIISQDYLCFSPITHGYPSSILSEYKEQPDDYYLTLDLMFAKLCRVLVILTLDDWEKSEGLKKETEFFLNNSCPVFYISKEKLLKHGLPKDLQQHPEAIKSSYKQNGISKS